MAVLDELKIEYRLREVDIEGGECETPAYRDIQPLGLVPAPGLPDGTVIFESAAMVQYLVDRHGGGRLAPAPDEPDRPAYLQWIH